MTEKKECPRCDEVFEPLTEFQTFCSFDCAGKKWAKRRYEKTKVAPRLPNYKIFERDGFTCTYCGKSSVEDKVELTVDHIVPRKRELGEDISKFSLDEINNLATSCRSCNSSKNNHVLEGDSLRRILEEVKKRNAEYAKRCDVFLNYCF